MHDTDAAYCHTCRMVSWSVYPCGNVSVCVLGTLASLALTAGLIWVLFGAAEP